MGSREKIVVSDVPTHCETLPDTLRHSETQTAAAGLENVRMKGEDRNI